MKWVVTDKQKKKKKIVEASEAWKAVFGVCKDKKDFKNYAVELFTDHNALQERSISILGYRVADSIPDKNKEREKYAAIDSQLQLIGLSLSNFSDLLGLPILIQFPGGEA